MESFEAILNHIRQRVALSQREASLLTTKLRIKTYPKGQLIGQAGDVVQYQSFVVSGSVKTYYQDKKGHEHVVQLGMEDWWVGDISSFLSQTPAEFNSQCLEKTSVIQISYEDTQQLYDAIPIMDRYFRLIIQKAYGHLSKRIIRNQSMPAKERYLHFLATYPKMVDRFPLYLIASYLGITKEFLSNIRRNLMTESE